MKQVEVGASSLGDLFLEHGLGWIEDEYEEGLGLSTRMSVFNGGMTLWLMVAQRAIAGNTLASTVQQLKQSTTLEGVFKLVSKSKRYALSMISVHPGGFSNARKRLPLEKVEEFSDHVSRSADDEHLQLSLINGYRCYIFDGSTIALQNNAAIRAEFPPIHNQHKEYQPAARIVVAHNVITGGAYRPVIGSLFESEQALCVSLMDALPKGALVIADRNFGVFSVGWHLQQRGLVPLVRLQKERASAILGVKEIKHDGDYSVTWTPSKNDRKTTEFPADAALLGRVIVTTIEVPGKRSERFYFFTTAKKLTPQQVAEMYKYRWFVEGDLKSIKGTVNLDVIKAKTPDMIRKEIVLGVVGYSFIRTLIARGAKMLNLMPRQFSFSRARGHLITLSIWLARAQNTKEIQCALNNFLPGLRQCKLPERSKPRVEPRAIVSRKQSKFSTLKSTREEARKLIIKKRISNA